MPGGPGHDRLRQRGHRPTDRPLLRRGHDPVQHHRRHRRARRQPSERPAIIPRHPTPIPIPVNITDPNFTTLQNLTLTLSLAYPNLGDTSATLTSPGGTDGHPLEQRDRRRRQRHEPPGDARRGQRRRLDAQRQSTLSRLHRHHARLDRLPLAQRRRRGPLHRALPALRQPPERLPGAGRRPGQRHLDADDHPVPPRDHHGADAEPDPLRRLARLHLGPLRRHQRRPVARRPDLPQQRRPHLHRRHPGRPGPAQPLDRLGQHPGVAQPAPGAALHRLDRRRLRTPPTAPTPTRPSSSSTPPTTAGPAGPTAGSSTTTTGSPTASRPAATPRPGSGRRSTSLDPSRSSAARPTSGPRSSPRWPSTRTPARWSSRSSTPATTPRALRVANYIAASTDGGSTFAPETYANAHLASPAATTSPVIDAITGKPVNLGPIPDNQSSGNNNQETTFGFGQRQGLAVANGHIIPVWSSNQNAGQPDPQRRSPPEHRVGGPHLRRRPPGHRQHPGPRRRAGRRGQHHPGGRRLADRQHDRPHLRPRRRPGLVPGRRAINPIGTSPLQVFYNNPSGTPAGVPLRVLTVTHDAADTIYTVTFDPAGHGVGTYSYTLRPLVRGMIPYESALGASSRSRSRSSTPASTAARPASRSPATPASS